LAFQKVSTTKIKNKLHIKPINPLLKNQCWHLSIDYQLKKYYWSLRDLWPLDQKKPKTILGIRSLREFLVTFCSSKSNRNKFTTHLKYTYNLDMP
jgi:hypothetical protein